MTVTGQQFAADRRGRATFVRYNLFASLYILRIFRSKLCLLKLSAKNTYLVSVHGNNYLEYIKKAHFAVGFSSWM